MCDAPSAWELVARAPGALAFGAFLTAFAAPDAYPGGSAAYLGATVVVLVVVRLLKLATAAATQGAEWAMRPDIGLAPSPGFPSSHAAAMAFACVAFGAEAEARRTPRHWALAGFVGALTVCVCLSRAATRCHSAAQIAAGLCVGLLLGLAYVRLRCIRRR